MSLRSSLARIGLCLCGLVAVFSAHAAGYEDLGFGDRGFARIAGASAQGPQAVLVRPDGRLVVAARRHDGSAIVVGKLKRNGSMDGGFNGGTPLAIPGSGALYSPKLANDPVSQATILAFADFQSGVYRLVLCRLLDSGALDTSFTIGGYAGQAGCVRTNPPAGAPNGIVVAGVEVWSTGRIVVGGTAYDFSAAAIGKPFEGSVLPGSNLDLYVVPVAGDYVINAMTSIEGTDVRYLAGQRRASASDFAGVVVRSVTGSAITATLNTNLVPDGFDDVRAMTMVQNSRLVVAATVDAPNQTTTCMLYAMDPASLAPDTIFGQNQNGSKNLHFGGTPAMSTRCDAITFAGNMNRIHVGGRITLSSDWMAVARLSPVGQNDPDYGNFDVIGYSLFNATPPGGQARSTQVLAIGVQDGRAILAGPSTLVVGPTPANSEMLVVRTTDDEHLFNGDFE